MKRLVGVVVLFSLLGGYAPAHASELEVLSPEQAQTLISEIDVYFAPGTEETGRLKRLEAMGLSGLPAIHFLLKAVLERLGQESPTTGRRMVRLLGLASRMAAVTATPPRRSFLSALVQRQTATLLERYWMRGAGQEHLFEILDRLGLWAPEHLTFVIRQCRTSERLKENLMRIRLLIPQVGQERRLRLAAFLHEFQPRDPVQLSLLFELGEIRTSELKLYFLQMARAFARHWMEPESAHDFRDDYVTDVLQQVMTEYEAGSPLVHGALQAAETTAARSQAAGRQQLLESLFFILFRDGELRWSDPRSWWKEGNRVAPPPRAPAAANNVIYVDFSSRCEDQLR